MIVGGVIKLIPLTGVTMPYISYGGSSMLAVYIYLGFIMSISSHNRKYYFEREKS